MDPAPQGVQLMFSSSEQAFQTPSGGLERGFPVSEECGRCALNRQALPSRWAALKAMWEVHEGHFPKELERDAKEGRGGGEGKVGQSGAAVLTPYLLIFF